MKEISLNVQKEFCGECTLALKRFIGKMPGVESIDVDNGRITISFNDARLMEKDLLQLTRESIERLGYRLTD